MESESDDSPIKALDIPSSILGRVLLRLHMARTRTQAVVHSAGLFVCLTFVPLLFLSVVTGTEMNGSIEMPLRSDYITLSRYLLAAPLLILSELLTRPWLIKVAVRFREITEAEDVDRYDRMFKRAFKIRNSIVIDLVVLAVAFASSLVGTSVVLGIEPSSWQLNPNNGISALSIPGTWNAFVSQPLFRFVVLSWLVDYVVWVYFLWRVSRFQLRVIATHADGVGGLSFVSIAQSQFCLAAFALSCAICSVVAQTVQHTHVKLQSFTNFGIVFLAVILILFVGPLLVFTPTLVQTKLKGVFSYGALSHELSQLFAKKWIGAKENKSILDSANPSTLTDLNSSFQTVLNMKPTIFDRQFVIGFVVATCLPAVPLVASVIPLQDIFMQIFKALT